MTYVYMLQSISNPEHYYVGLNSDLKARFAAHNRGESSHTSKYAPWQLVTYVAFSDSAKASTFERYLKTASGRAFAKKHF
jgi:putative endonuclease